jgi:regulator of nonsense transcripts 3
MAPTTATAPNGVLQISTAALNKPASTTPKNPGGKANAPRLKIVIRRLAPGLTEAEFKEAIGDEWKVGGGKVDWLVFKAGKVSKE